MSRITYEEAFADWEYLWTQYGPAADMTGGYVDQEDLDRLLRSPTKATARRCLMSQIAYWFEKGTDSISRQPDRSDERLQEIADRYGISW